MPARSAFQNKGRQTRIALVKANRPPRATQTSRRSHVVTSAHRYFLRARRQGQRPFLRSQTRRRKTVDREALDLRPAYQQAFYAKRKSAKAQRPRRLRRLL